MSCRVSQISEVSELAHAQLSETWAIALKSGTAAWQLAPAEAVWFVTVIVGGVTSYTVIVCVHDSVPFVVVCVASGNPVPVRVHVLCSVGCRRNITWACQRTRWRSRVACRKGSG